MIIFPAIDMRLGRVVRLEQGRLEAETVYGDDPAQIARQWESEGAEWLHVINLDGAFGTKASANMLQLTRVISSVGIPIQFGGGLRDMASIEIAFNLGVARVVLGTAAIENPSLISASIERYGSERIVVGIDARNGLVSTHGWQEQSAVLAIDLVRAMATRGVGRMVYTDIARDGMLNGLDAATIAQVGREAQVKIIASGGVADLKDIVALRECREIEGVIIGQALYRGKLSLREVIGAGKETYSLS